MNAIIYRRSADLNEQWLDDQDSSCRTYAREHALMVTGSYYDIGRTGDGLASMLEAVQQKDVAAVIVNDIARLGDRINDHLATVRRLHDAGVTIHIAQEKITGTQGTRLLGVIQAYAEADAHLGDHSPCVGGTNH